MTPLHVASAAGNGLDTGCDTASSGSIDSEFSHAAGTIADLINRGAAVNHTTDCYGETPLHLAARKQRADAAKILLERGR